MQNILTNKDILRKAKQNEQHLNDLINSEQASKYIKYVIKTYTKSPAKFMAFNQVEFEDLMQLGRIGLYRGIQDLDVTKSENEIKRYLYQRIQGEVRSVARSNSSNNLVINQRIRGIYPKYLKYQQAFYLENFRDPTIEETMQHFNLSKDDTYDLVYGMQAVISETAQSQLEDGETISLWDYIEQRFFNPTSKSVEQQVINRLVLEEKLALLNQKERTVLNMKYVQGYNNSEISRHIGCVNSMVNKYLKTAFVKLTEA